MPMDTQKIESEALNLDIQACAKLAGKWFDEAERRLDEYRAGKVQGVPANEVFQRAIAELS